MDQFHIRINAEDGSFEIVSGQRRMQAMLESGMDVDAVDTQTGKRYQIKLKDGSMVATEVTNH